jgi:hypothetical protein
MAVDPAGDFLGQLLHMGMGRRNGRFPDDFGFLSHLNGEVADDGGGN